MLIDKSQKPSIATAPPAALGGPASVAAPGPLPPPVAPSPLVDTPRGCYGSAPATEGARPASTVPAMSAVARPAPPPSRPPSRLPAAAAAALSPAAAPEPYILSVGIGMERTGTFRNVPVRSQFF